VSIYISWVRFVQSLQRRGKKVDVGCSRRKEISDLGIGEAFSLDLNIPRQKVRLV
jgi:hypothetical protein